MIATLEFALFALLPFGPAEAPPARQETVREPKSEVPFPVRLEVAGSDAAQTLIGVGLRTKTIFKVKVYAIGLYVDAPAAAGELARWKEASARELEKDRAFYAALVEGEFGKTIRMVMTRDVDADDMVEAFDDVLKPRITEADKRWRRTGGPEALKRFRAQFDLRELKKGTELVFTWHPKGRLITSVGGKVKGEIESESLCWALFDSYLGKKPVQDSIKESLIARYPVVAREAGADSGR